LEHSKLALPLTGTVRDGSGLLTPTVPEHLERLVV
jgi:hypothetical protein